MSRVAQRSPAMPVTRALLAEAIDYAGLFPPAALSMREAVRAYARYRASADAWALGRFIVPVGRLDELAAELTSLEKPAAIGWRFAAIAGRDAIKDWDAAREASLAGGTLDAYEVRVTTPTEIHEIASTLPESVDTYFEISVAADPAPLIAAIASVGGNAKVRTGGVSADAFPSARDLSRFLRACAEARVSFKATAGLHHAIRGDYRLTYAVDSDVAPMFGFLNVLLAAALARQGVGSDVLQDVLNETRADAFHLTSDGVRWRDLTIPADVIAGTRRSFALSFGSCSFEEPIDELVALRLL